MPRVFCCVFVAQTSKHTSVVTSKHPIFSQQPSNGHSPRQHKADALANSKLTWLIQTTSASFTI